MKKKLLIIGVTVLILAMVPVAALNLFGDRGEEGNSGSIGGSEQHTGEKNPEEPLDRDEEPKEPELEDPEGTSDEEDQEDRESEENAGDQDSNASESEDSQESKDEEKDKDSENGNNGDGNSDGNSDGNGNDEEETIVWGDLGFSDTMDVFLQEIEEDLTRRDLAKLSVLFYEQLSGQEATPAWEETFEDTQSTWVLKAYNLGIVSDEEDGKFDPDRGITRQEGAHTFYRILRALDRPYPDGDLELIAEDVERIDNYAYEAVAFMDYYEILPRRDENKVNPEKQIVEGEIKALWNNTRQWVESYDRYSEGLEAPTGVFAEEHQGEAKIGWEPVEDGEYYHVYEALSEDGPFHAFSDRNGRPLKVYWDEDYSLKVTGLTEGQTYYYRVRAVVDGIRSPKSEVVKVTATSSVNKDFEDYEAYLMKDYNHFELGDQIVEFENIEISRGSDEEELNLRYYVDGENSEKLRRVIQEGYREDLRTLYGYIIREMSDFYEKDVNAYLIYEDSGLEEFPQKYQDNRIEEDPIGEGSDGTYFVWFPYLEMIWDYEHRDFSHRWFYENEGA